MADVHLGAGATVGSVVAMKGAVSPAAVGVDIGCGMGAVRASLSARRSPEGLHRLRSDIEAVIPVGFSMHKSVVPSPAASALWAEFPGLSDKVQGLFHRAELQMGTLGGGNHFFELCLDTADAVWIMLHSGSRNIGEELAEIHIARANRQEAGPTNRDLPPTGISPSSSPAPTRWLPTARTSSGPSLRPREPRDHARSRPRRAARPLPPARHRRGHLLPPQLASPRSTTTGHG